MLGNLKMRYKMLLNFLIVSLIPIIFVGVYSFYQAKSNIEAEVFEKNHLFMDLTKSQLEDFFIERKGDATVLRENYVLYNLLSDFIKNGERGEAWIKLSSEMDKMLKRAMEQYGYDGIFVTDNSGKVIYASSFQDKLHGQDLSSREYIKRALEGSINWSEIFYSELLNDNTIVLSTPVFENGADGSVIGTLNFFLNQKHIDEIVHEGIEFIGKSGDSYLINMDGLLLTNTRLGEFSKDAALKKTIQTKAVEILKEPLKIKQMNFYQSVEYKDYLGNQVLGVMGVINLGDTPAGLIVEVNAREAFAGVNKQRQAVVLFVVIVAVLGLLLSLGFSRLIVNPIYQGVEMSSALGAGDLTKSINISRNDEMGVLSRALNNAVENIRKVIQKISDIVSENTALSEELSATVEELSAQSQSINSNTQEIAAGMEETSASTEEITALAQEVGKAIEELATKVQAGYKVVGEIEKRALHLKNNFEESLNVARTMYSERQSDIMQAVNEAKVVEEIGEMAKAISEIANKTNLLALNAAIEAARVGERGKGFAVVAEEIRQLAEQSGETVEKINNLIQRVNYAVTNLSQNSEGILKFIDEKVGSDYQTMLNTGNQYLEDAKTVGDMVENFNSRAQQIAAAMEEVNKSIEAISKTIEQATTSSIEISNQLGQTAAGIDEVSNVAQKLTDQVKGLEEIIQRFKV